MASRLSASRPTECAASWVVRAARPITTMKPAARTGRLGTAADPAPVTRGGTLQGDRSLPAQAAMIASRGGSLGSRSGGGVVVMSVTIRWILAAAALVLLVGGLVFGMMPKAIHISDCGSVLNSADMSAKTHPAATVCTNALV